MSNLYSKEDMELAKQIINNNKIRTQDDMSGAFKNIMGCIVQTLLDAEMQDHLGYDKSSHSDKENDNRRNGVTSKSKKVTTTFGDIVIAPPRDRDATFEPVIVKKRQRILDKIDDLAIMLYAKGSSQEDISKILQEIYGVKISAQTISAMTETISQEAIVWQHRPLEKCYPFAFVDCIYCNVRQELISNKIAVYVMIGIDTTGHKDILGIWTDNTESASFWGDIFEEIKSRGVDDIMFVSMDGLAGLSEAIERSFPKTKMQICIVHQGRNLYKSIPKKDAKETMSDFKKIYTASNLSICKCEYENFKIKYSDKPKILDRVARYIENIYALFEQPEAIRKMIYTTNAIESFNSVLRRTTNGKGTFIHENAMKKLLYLKVKSMCEKWKNPVTNWKQLCIELTEIFEERFTKYIL